MTLIAFYAANLIARHSATVEDIVTVDCFFKAHLIRALASLIN